MSQVKSERTESVTVQEQLREGPQAPPGAVDWSRVARRLRRHRQTVLELTGAAMARRAGLSQQYYNSIERGSGGSMSGDTLMKLAVACGQPLTWLLTGPDPDDRPDWLEPELAELLRELGPERRLALVELLRRNPNLPDPAELAAWSGLWN